MWDWELKGQRPFSQVRGWGGGLTLCHGNPETRDGGRFSNEKDLSNSHIAKHIRVTQDQGKLMVRFRFD